MVCIVRRTNPPSRFAAHKDDGIGGGVVPEIAGVVAVEHGVDALSCASVEDVGVHASAADESVAARASSKDVIACVAHQQVSLAATGECVRTVAAEHEGATVQGVGGGHAGGAGLDVPVAQDREHGLDDLLFLCGEQASADELL